MNVQREKMEARREQWRNEHMTETNHEIRVPNKRIYLFIFSKQNNINIIFLFYYILNLTCHLLACFFLSQNYEKDDNTDFSVDHYS